MNSSLLPASLARLAGHPVVPMALEALEHEIASDAAGVLATNSSTVGRFCAYWVPAGSDQVYRVSTDFAVRARLKRLAKAHPNVRFLATGEVL
jgi:hypothetical protein